MSVPQPTAEAASPPLDLAACAQAGRNMRAAQKRFFAGDKKAYAEARRLEQHFDNLTGRSLADGVKPRRKGKHTQRRAAK